MATQKDPRSDLSPRKVAERLKEEGKQKLEQGKSSAAEQVSSVASALKSAGNELNQPTLAAYANQLAGTIERFGSRLREGSIEDLIGDVQGAARRNPGLFIAGGFAIGFLVARLVKASAEREPLLVETEFEELGTGSTAEETSEDYLSSTDRSNPYGG